MNTSIYSSFANNIILNTDSYKVGHYLQYPSATEQLYSYTESRGGRFDRTVFFGLQMFLKEYLSRPVTDEMIDEAKNFYAQHLANVPFNEDGWRYLVNEYGGKIPIRIRAVAEGSVIPTGNVLATVESLDAQLAWVAQYIEAALLRAIWYPTTVATQSWFIKQRIRDYLQSTATNIDGLPFMLHDFGARGVSSLESAAIGGAAHLVNFMGSDTIAGVLAANRYYNAGMAGFSIAAAEHSTVTAWGKENEVEAYRNMLQQFARPGSVVAVVSDSYDIYNAVKNIWGRELRQQVVDSGATVVIRPDSGDPVEVVTNVMRQAHLAFGSTFNQKGYRVLRNVRIIQGDGVNEDSIVRILQAVKENGFSAENLAFGMGGALLQQIDRDTQKFATKLSAIKVNGKWRDVYKQPVTDQGKSSKRGRITLMYNPTTKSYCSCVKGKTLPPGYVDALQTVFENGEIVQEYSFDEVRNKSEASRLDTISPCLAVSA